MNGVVPITNIALSEEQEAKKKRELGMQGMKKNYDDLKAGLARECNSLDSSCRQLLDSEGKE